MINFNIFIYTYLYVYIVKYIYIGYIYLHIKHMYNIYICIFIHNAIQTLIIIIIVPKDRVIKSITGACYRMLITRQVMHTPLPNGWEIRT